MNNFRGDTGKVRKVIASFGGYADAQIFNDKRKTFRRIKIWTVAEFMFTSPFKAALAKEFGDRFEGTNIITYKGYFETSYSYVIFLKD